MSSIKSKIGTLPFNCQVLGAQQGKETAVAFVVFDNKFESNEQVSKIFLGRSFIDCQKKDDCGIYEQQPNGEWDYTWAKCPAKQAFP